MIINFNKAFKKMLKKQDQWLKEKLEERIVLFLENEYNYILNNHALKGDWLGCRSIDITGDVRAIFRMIDSQKAIFIAIGTHSELYE